MEWFGFALLAAIVWSMVEVMDKFIVDNEIGDSVLDASVCGIANFGLLFLVSVFLLSSTEPVGVLVAVVSGFLYFGALLVYYSGMGKEEVSRFAPTLSLDTIFVVLLSFLIFNESLALETYLGVFLAVGGAFLISLEDPLDSLREMASGRGFRLAVLTAALFGTRDVVFKLASLDVSYWTAMFGMSAGGLVFSLITFRIKNGELDSGSKGFQHLVIVGILTGLGYLAYAKAISLGSVSLASTVLKALPVIVFVASLAIARRKPGLLGEELDRATILHKTFALGLIVLGLLIIK